MNDQVVFRAQTNKGVLASVVKCKVLGEDKYSLSIPSEANCKTYSTLRGAKIAISHWLKEVNK